MSEALLPTPYTNKNAPAVVQTETPERRSGEVTTWQEIDHAQVERPLDGAYLGRVVDSSGRSAGFRDKLETPVADKGFMFGVAQASYGYTGVYVQPLPGFKAEALHYDDETQQASWVAGQRSSDTVNVDSDWGKMSDITADLWAQETNYGNPGVRGGIIRVTDANEVVKYYALGAQFDGKPDEWFVNGALVEVVPTNPSLLPSAAPELDAGQ